MWPSLFNTVISSFTLLFPMIVFNSILWLSSIPWSPCIIVSYVFLSCWTMGCLHFLAIFISAAMNLGVQRFFSYADLISFQSIPVTQLMDHTVTHSMYLKETLYYFFTWLYFTFPPSVCKDSFSLIPSPMLSAFSLFEHSYSYWSDDEGLPAFSSWTSWF